MDNYTNTHLIGEGSFSKVYQTHNKKTPTTHKQLNQNNQQTVNNSRIWGVPRQSVRYA